MVWKTGVVYSHPNCLPDHQKTLGRNAWHCSTWEWSSGYMVNGVVPRFWCPRWRVGPVLCLNLTHAQCLTLMSCITVYAQLAFVQPCILTKRELSNILDSTAISNPFGLHHFVTQQGLYVMWTEEVGPSREEVMILSCVLLPPTWIWVLLCAFRDCREPAGQS